MPSAHKGLDTMPAEHGLGTPCQAGHNPYVTPFGVSSLTALLARKKAPHCNALPNCSVLLQASAILLQASFNL
jgi:hypothetical protein